MTVLLGIGSALFIGLADVLVSFVVRRGSVVASAAWNFVLATPLTFGLALLFTGSVSVGAVVFGLLAGAAAGFALLFLLAGYACAEIGVVGPIAGVIGAGIPIAMGIALDGLPSRLGVLGLAAGVVAVGLVAIAKSGPTEGAPRSGPSAARAGVAMAAGAGVLYGLVAVLLGLVDDGAGIWPAAMVRLGGAACLLAVVRQQRTPLRQTRSNGARLLASATFAAGGMACFALAAQRDVAVAGLLVQMAYAVSVVGAAMLYRERANSLQLTGFAIAVVSVVLISVA